MAERSWLRLRICRGAAVALLLAVTAGCSPLDDVLQGVFGRSMRVQPSLGTYENPIAPPEGSVPFAAGNFPAAPGVVNVGQPEVAAIPEPVTQTQLFQQLPEVTGIVNPVAASPASLARGEVVFNRACSPCHGAAADGQGPVTTAGIPAFSLLTPIAAGYPDGYLYTIIRIGRGIMPAYGHQISHYDRWHVVNYLRSLQDQAGLIQPPAPAPAPTPAPAQDQ